MGYLPEVRIQTREQLALTIPGGPAVIGIIGTAQWGEVNSVQVFSSNATLQSYYKNDKNGLTLVKGADIAYTNGAYIMKAVRVASSSKSKASAEFNSGATLVLTFYGKYHGTYGNNIYVEIKARGTGRTIRITDGVIIENFTNNNDPNGYATNQAIANAINNGSSLCSVVVASGQGLINLVDAATEYLSGGNDGENVTTSDIENVFDEVLSSEDFDILLVPGQTEDSFHQIITSKLDNRANIEKKYAMYFTGVDLNETIATQKSRTANGSRLVLVSPSMTYTTEYQTESLNLDGSYLACAVAGQVARRDVEVSPTRKSVAVEGLIVDLATGKKYYSNAEMEELLGAGIVPVSLIAGSLKIARGVTRVTDKTSIYYEINIQRIVDYLKDKVQTALDSFLGEPNLLRVRDNIASVADNILHQATLDETIAAYLPTSVSEGISPDTVNVSMTIRPTFAVNYINVTLTITSV